MNGKDDNSGFFSNDDLSGPAGDGQERYGYVIGKCIYVSETGFSELNLAKKGGRLFVLKALKPEHRFNPVALASLEKEFDITFSLDIHGVTNVFDFIYHPEKGKCLVLKYYSGSNLRELIENGYQFSGKEINAIWHSLISSVREIHRRGIVHRDIKPSNIMYDPETGEVTLIDFGCADTYDQLNFKGLAGTPFYMPEKDAGTPAADWYALSKVFEEICATNNVKSFQRNIKDSLKRMGKGKPPYNEPNINGRRRKRLLIVLVMIVGFILTAIVFFFPVKRTGDKGKNAEAKIEERSNQKNESEKNVDTLYLELDNKTPLEPITVNNLPDRTVRHTTEKPQASHDKDSLESEVDSLLDRIIKYHTEDVWWEAAKKASKVWHDQTLTEEEKKRKTVELINEDKWCSEVLALCEEKIKEITPMPDRAKIETLVHQRYRKQCKYFEQLYGVKPGSN